jgi:hypothetical protein
MPLVVIGADGKVDAVAVRSLADPAGEIHAVQVQRRPPTQDPQGQIPGHELGGIRHGAGQRGSLTVWMTEDAIAAWQAPATGKAGWLADLLRVGARIDRRLCFPLSVWMSADPGGDWHAETGHPVEHIAPDFCLGPLIG